MNTPLFQIGQSLLSDYQRWLSASAAGREGMYGDEIEEIFGLRRVLEQGGLLESNYSEWQTLAGLLTDDLVPNDLFAENTPLPTQEIEKGQPLQRQGGNQSVVAAPAKQNLTTETSTGRKLVEQSTPSGGIDSSPVLSGERQVEAATQRRHTAAPPETHSPHLARATYPQVARPVPTPDNQSAESSEGSQNNAIRDSWETETKAVLPIPLQEPEIAVRTNTSYAPIKGLKDFASQWKETPFPPFPSEINTGQGAEAVNPPVITNLEKSFETQAVSFDTVPLAQRSDLPHLPERAASSAIAPPLATPSPDIDDLVEAFEQRIQNAFRRFYG